MHLLNYGTAISGTLPVLTLGKLRYWGLKQFTALCHFHQNLSPKISHQKFPQKTWWSREGNNKHICPISPTRETYRDKWSNRYRYHDNDGFPKWSLIKESTFMNICFRVLSYLVSSIIVQQNRLCLIYSLKNTSILYLKKNTNETNHNIKKSPQLFEPG